jgi:hypothetical protein
MKKTNAMLVGALIGSVLATPVLAAAEEKVCLQHNRIYGMRAFDERTIVVTDRTQKRYTVHVGPGCLGLKMADAHFVFRMFTSLSCISAGDVIGVTTPHYGYVPCVVAGVDGGVPAPAPG